MRRFLLGMALVSVPVSAHPGHHDEKVEPAPLPQVHRDRSPSKDNFFGVRPKRTCLQFGLDSEKRPTVRCKIRFKP